MRGQAKKMSKNTKKSLIVAILAVFVGIFAFSLTYAVASSITAKNIIKLVNEARNKEGLKPLQENSKLSAAAAAKAADMLKNDYFAHNSPSGKTPWYWLEKSGYNYKYAGENLAMNFSSAEEEQKAWMKSPTHKKNILNANYQEIGVAVAEGKIDGKSTTVAVQMFGATPYVVPVSQKAPADVPVENKAAVLGDESNGFLPAVERTALNEETPVNNLSHEQLMSSGLAPMAAGSLWAKIKETLFSENRPDWVTPLALNTLWMILGGNLLFLAFSVGRKVKVAGKKREKKSAEQKIPVENLEDAEEDVSVPVTIISLHVHQLKP